jgi:carbon storage regulator
VLILSRRAGESVVIGDGIRIVVLASDRRGVRIGIEAPAHVSIVREEILQQVTTQNRRASAGAGAKALVDGVVAAEAGSGDDSAA